MHQMLVGLIGRKMREKGYEIVAFDGNEYKFDGQVLPLPPSIGRHRPDIIGYRFESRSVCIGEAKTGRDLRSDRTKTQLIDFSQARTLTNNEPVEIIIGIPQSYVKDLISLLDMLGITNKQTISYVYIPEELVDGTEKN